MITIKKIEENIVLLGIIILLIFSLVLVLTAKPFFELPDYVELVLMDYIETNDGYLLSFNIKNTKTERSFNYLITVKEEGSPRRYVLYREDIVLKENQEIEITKEIGITDYETHDWITGDWDYETYFWTTQDNELIKISVELNEE